MKNRQTIVQALEQLSGSADRTYGVVFEHGSLQLGLYKPHRSDPQQPHDRDEVYVICSGSGFFLLEDEREPVATGDALFVPAGARHRFEKFTNDFAAWVMFYGPTGGEQGSSTA